MKIAFIAHNSSLIYNFRLPLIKRLLLLGHEVVAICPKDGVKSLDGLKHISWECTQKTSFLPNLADLFKLMFLLKANKFDLIQACAHKANIFASLCHILMPKPKLVLLVEGRGNALLKGGFKAYLIKMLYKISFKQAYFITLSKHNADFLISLGQDKDKISIIKGVGIDLKRFMPLRKSPHERLAFAKKYSLNPALPNVLMAARMLVFKGCLEYFSVAKKLHKKANFLYAGSLDKGEFYIKQSEIEAAKHVCFLGECKDMSKIYNYCDIFCLPSYAEGYSVSVQEAMASGCALALSFVEGNDEVGLNARDVLYFDVHNEKDFTNTLHTLIKESSLRTSLASNAYKIILSQGSEQIVEKYLSLYEKITRK